MNGPKVSIIHVASILLHDHHCNNKNLVVLKTLYAIRKYSSEPLVVAISLTIYGINFCELLIHRYIVICIQRVFYGPEDGIAR